MPSYAVSELFIHPIKSFQALSVDEAKVDNFGFYSDRRFMLIDRSTGGFITQRKYPELTRLSAHFDGQQLKVFGNELEGGSIIFSLDEFGQEAHVSVWSDEVEALLVANDYRVAALSAFLNKEVSLAYMPDSTYRQVDESFFPDKGAVSFADGFPFLLANKASLDDLNSRLKMLVNMKRFRPNIVFNGDKAFQEDNWKRIAIGEVRFEVVKPCSRCVMTCVDEDGVRQKEPLATLATYRNNEYGVCFGQNMVQLNTGTIRVGDKIEVLA